MAIPASNYTMAFNGWLFGGIGQGVQILSVEGLESQPELRTQDDTRGYQDGQLTGRDFLNGRNLSFTLQAMNDANGTMHDYLEELKLNLAFQQQGTGVLQFLLPGRSLQQVEARVRRRHIKIDPEYTYGRSVIELEMFCPDPRIYDDALQSMFFTPQDGFGRTYNRVYPLLYNNSTGVPGNSGTATNAGNYTTFPTFTITGPCTNPIILNQSTGAYLAFNKTLLGNDVLVVDPDLRIVTFNGAPARNLLLNGSNWFGIAPGSTTIGFVASVYSTGASMTTTWRNAYI